MFVAAPTLNSVTASLPSSVLMPIDVTGVPGPDTLFVPPPDQPAVPDPKAMVSPVSSNVYVAAERRRSQRRS